LDDTPLAEVLPRVTRRVITYGLDARHADLTVVDVSMAPLGATATVLDRTRARGLPHRHGETGTTLGEIQLRVPGRHNLQNALAAVAVGLELGLSFDRIAAGLGEFRGAERRFEVRGEPNGVLVVDDYGHHPTEIAAVIAAAQAFGRRIIVAFQPHRFSRTSMLMDAFGPALSRADHVVLTDIYGAGEDPLPGVTIEALAASIEKTSSVAVEVVPRLADVAPVLARTAQPGDMVITLGAGSIATVPEQLIDLLERGERGDTTVRTLT
jgi:UDP-N-acetylmuramate--alanine ligase